MWIAAGAAAVIIVAVALASIWLNTPHPVDSLTPTDRQPDEQDLKLIGYSLDRWEMDMSALRSFGSFHSVDVWTSTDRYASPCLFIVEKSTDALLEAACTPHPADLLADIGVWPYFPDDIKTGFADGTVIRFRKIDDRVDVFVYPPAAG